MTSTVYSFCSHHLNVKIKRINALTHFHISSRLKFYNKTKVIAVKIFYLSGPEVEVEAAVPDRPDPTLDPQQQEERQLLENHRQTE